MGFIMKGATNATVDSMV
uniref:Uncharacterized protein n=1 Tax=Oryza sativa subsp. japonica TaxID=39947 RepID=Q75I46_ORYSJ|nr:hypothetical protein [Oryza sativa Japonica Group]